MHKDARKIKARIRSAFERLFDDNIIGMPNFTCCGSCGRAEIDKLVKRDGFSGWAFYHAQDNDDINASGQTYIAFGDNKKVAKKVVAALTSSKLRVDWDGHMGTRILVEGLA